MMKNILYLFILTLFVSPFYSCDENPIIDIPEKEPDTTQQFLEVLWHAPMDSTREIVTSDFIHYYKDYVITSGDIWEDGKFFLFDKNTGEKLHTIHFEGNVSQDVNESILYENILIAYTSDGLVAFNLDNFEMVWEIDFEPLEWYYNHPLSIDKEKIIINVTKKGFGDRINDGCVMVSIDPLSGDYHMLVESRSNGKYSPVHGLPLIFKDSKENIKYIIYTVEKDDLKDPLEQQQDLYCVNAINGEVIWSDINMGKPASSRGVRTHYYDSTAIVSNDWSIYGYDVNTGERKWRYEFEMYKPFASWGNTLHHLEDNRLYVNSVGEGVGCIDVSTGQLRWFNEDAGANCAPKMLYVDDMLIYGSFGNGTITVLDAFTGKMLYHRPPVPGQGFTNNVTYNEKEDIFYTMSYDDVIAFKLNRE